MVYLSSGRPLWAVPDTRPVQYTSNEPSGFQRSVDAATGALNWTHRARLQVRSDRRQSPMIEGNTGVFILPPKIVNYMVFSVLKISHYLSVPDNPCVRTQVAVTTGPHPLQGSVGNLVVDRAFSSPRRSLQNVSHTIFVAKMTWPEICPPSSSRFYG